MHRGSDGGDILVTGGTLVTERAIYPYTDVAIVGGRIAKVGRAAEMPRGLRRFDAIGRYVLPGVIDAHVHLREPGLTYKEDYLDGTGAAALGGVTCVFDMPNTEPPSDTAARLREKIVAVEGSAWTDFATYGLLSRGGLRDLGDLTRSGIIGVKVFLGQSEQGPGCPLPPGEGELDAAMTLMAAERLRLAVHAENHDMIAHGIGEMKRAGATGLEAHRRSRPPAVEVEAISRVGILAEATGCPVHILHVSSGAGAATVRSIRKRGVDLTAETCPHYLLPDDAALTDVRRRVNPPVRGMDDALALRIAVVDGTIQVVASDHAPHADHEKAGSDVWKVRAGLIGTQHMLQLLLAYRDQLGLELPDIVRITSAEPARVWGLWPTKGSVQPGAHGDLTIIDLDSDWLIEASSIRSKHSFSPYLGWAGKGRPVGSIVRGRVVSADGRLVGAPSGAWVSRIRQRSGR